MEKGAVWVRAELPLPNAHSLHVEGQLTCHGACPAPALLAMVEEAWVFRDPMRTPCGSSPTRSRGCSQAGIC